MHQHNHYNCAHLLNHCSLCDVTFCTQCKKEWVANHWMWNSPYWTTTTPDLTITTSGIASDSGSTYTITAHNHGGS